MCLTAVAQLSGTTPLTGEWAVRPSTAAQQRESGQLHPDAPELGLLSAEQPTPSVPTACGAGRTEVTKREHNMIRKSLRGELRRLDTRRVERSNSAVVASPRVNAAVPPTADTCVVDWQAGVVGPRHTGSFPEGCVGAASPTEVTA